MRYPVDNYKTEWDNHAGYDFGDPTSYGFHDGKDINDNGGGNSDLGKPLYAVTNGTIVGVHVHTSKPTFGKHFFLKIDGAWGTRYIHYAHCDSLNVIEGQIVKEGDKVATVGNSGTDYAHCHFAIKKKANGMDTIAPTKAQLDDAWEDPIAFVEKWITLPPEYVTLNGKIVTEQIIDDIRKERDINWNLHLKDQETITNLNQEVNDRNNSIAKLTGDKDLLAKQLTDCEVSSQSHLDQAIKLPDLSKQLQQAIEDRDSARQDVTTLNRQVSQLKNSSFKMATNKDLIGEFFSRFFAKW